MYAHFCVPVCVVVYVFSETGGIGSLSVFSLGHSTYSQVRAVIVDQVAGNVPDSPGLLYRYLTKESRRGSKHGTQSVIVQFLTVAVCLF